MINEEVIWCVDIACYMIIKSFDNFRLYEAVYDSYIIFAFRTKHIVILRLTRVASFPWSFLWSGLNECDVFSI